MCFVRKLNISFLHIISRFVCESDYISFCRLYVVAFDAHLNLKL